MHRILSLATVFLAIATTAHAGISTNGAAINIEENNAWFLGSQPIEYCIDSSDSYSVDQRTIERLVQESFEDWARFFVKYNLDKATFSHLKGDRQLGLALQAKEVPSCTDEKHQLHFMFGLTDDRVSDALEVQEGAIALDVRGTYDHNTYRNGGEIYVVDKKWSEPRLHHVILHELGHVFGLPHESVYVMSSQTAFWLLDNSWPDTRFGTIESSTWPYRPLDGSTVQFKNGATLAIQKDTLVLKTATATLTGQLVSDNEPAYAEANVGPRVHVLMACGECLYQPDCPKYCGPDGTGITKYLDPIKNWHTQQGVFMQGTEVDPAIFVQDHGLKLKVYMTNKKTWETFE